MYHLRPPESLYSRKNKTYNVLTVNFFLLSLARQQIANQIIAKYYGPAKTRTFTPTNANSYC